MRRIPKRVNTREDIYNLAMDLPPERVGPWMDSITDADLARVRMSREDYQIMRTRVALSRELVGEARRQLLAKVERLAGELVCMTRAESARGLETAHREVDAMIERAREVQRHVK